MALNFMDICLTDVMLTQKELENESDDSSLKYESDISSDDNNSETWNDFCTDVLVHREKNANVFIIV